MEGAVLLMCGHLGRIVFASVAYVIFIDNFNTFVQATIWGSEPFSFDNV